MLNEDPRSMEGIFRRGNNNYGGLPHSQGAGRPPGIGGPPEAGNLGFDLETIQRRLMSSAAGYRV